MTLERKQEDFRESVGPVKLYLEDIIAMVDLMSVFDAPVELQVDGATTSDPEDFRELDVVRDLEITVLGRGLRVVISRKAVRVLARAGDRHAGAVAAQLVLHLRQQRRRYVAFVTRAVVILPALVISLGTSTLVMTLPRNVLDRNGDLVVTFAGPVLLASIIMVSFFVMDDRRVRVVPRRRREAPSFWHRNRDDLLINVIVLALGLWLGHLIS
jgi:hypothetical protein